jgi:hypothetical protein
MDKQIAAPARRAVAESVDKQSVLYRGALIFSGADLLNLFGNEFRKMVRRLLRVCIKHVQFDAAVGLSRLYTEGQPTNVQAPCGIFGNFRIGGTLRCFLKD